MMWWMHDWGWWWLMPIPMLVFWGLVIWAVVTLIRGPDQGARSVAGLDPERVLAERYARGEIDAAEYRERLAVLRGTSRTAA